MIFLELIMLIKLTIRIWKLIIVKTNLVPRSLRLLWYINWIFN